MTAELFRERFVLRLSSVLLLTGLPGRASSCATEKENLMARARSGVHDTLHLILAPRSDVLATPVLLGKMTVSCHPSVQPNAFLGFCSTSWAFAASLAPGCLAVF